MRSGRVLTIAIAMLATRASASADPCCEVGPADDRLSCACRDCVCMVLPSCCDQGGIWDEACVVACRDCGAPCPCTPNCKGRECGPDGCGGVCGKCSEGKSCQNGHCVGYYPERCSGPNEPSAPTCYPGLDEKGCCDAASRAVFCGPDGALYCVDCGGGVCGLKDGELACVEGKESTEALCTGGPCVPACHGKECGPDGCGGVCGVCKEGAVCEDGRCRCNASCKDKECGPAAPCGGTCGYCKGGKVCVDGHCVLPPPEVTEDVPDASEGPLADKVGGSGCMAQSSPSLLLLLPLPYLRRRR